MKNFQKSLLLVILTVVSANVFAQTFSVKAGLNMANMVLKDDNYTYSDDFKMKPGINVADLLSLVLTTC